MNSDSYLVGIDGGGTRTTIGIADAHGRELLRHSGPAGIVDPKRPTDSAEVLLELIREATQAAGIRTPVGAICAGLAGVGNEAERRLVEVALEHGRLARRVLVRSDGETALFGAFQGGPGILLISGTGSVAYGRAEDGRVERCGGWGMVLGDEGAGYTIGREGLRAALMAADGRGMQSRLLPTMLEALGVGSPAEIASWAGRAAKSEIAHLAVHVFPLAEEDRVAREIVTEAALDLALHVMALIDRLRPWTRPPRVALHGGAARNPIFRTFVERVLEQDPHAVEIVEPAADAVSGALDYAKRSLAGEPTRQLSGP